MPPGNFRKTSSFASRSRSSRCRRCASGSTTCPSSFTSLLDDLGRGDLRIADATLTQPFVRHPWPGNVRELKNVLACAVAFVDAGATMLEPHHLKLLRPANDEESWLDGLPLGGQALERIERVAIRQTMAQAAGNKMYAARALGIAFRRSTRSSRSTAFSRTSRIGTWLDACAYLET